MICETYRADIPESTCIARLKAVYTPGMSHDPGCARCETGKQLYANSKKGETIMTGSVETTDSKDESMETKICTKCGQEKLFSGFYDDEKMRDKKKSWCKVCTRQASAKNKRAKKQGPASARVSAPVSAPVLETMPESPRPSLPGRAVMTLDFSGLTSLLETLKTRARQDFRTPEAQVMFLIDQALKPYEMEVK